MKVFDDSRGPGRFLVRLALGLALLICPGCKKNAAEAGDGSADGADSKREVGLQIGRASCRERVSKQV